jgi:hypothetical protein
MDVLRTKVSGRLTVEDFGKTLRGMASQMRPGDSYAFVLDILDMESYEPEVRDLYIRWHREYGSYLKRTAVVTNKTLWRMVVSTISMATGGGTRAFGTVEEANRWVQA